jgi:hypothetical protein
VRAFGAAFLLSLTGLGLGHPSHLLRLDPATLKPQGPAVRLPGWAFGFAWARRATTLAAGRSSLWSPIGSATSAAGASRSCGSTSEADA